MRFHLAEKLLPFESIFEKHEENDFPLEEIRTFFKYWPPDCNIGF